MGFCCGISDRIKETKARSHKQKRDRITNTEAIALPPKKRSHYHQRSDRITWSVEQLQNSNQESLSLP
ncbi:MAG: hypothetical protein F6J94_18135 [Moorea sp. SIO1F2]|uniref:hypothetical protein n=1 Tax=unclassified Moorena TaxID=2683338 RepID=UPI0013BCD683|nr:MULTISPECIES: hypothetical protein [unclassified Moorena]NEP24767.1 hypothetical protein [Moorena sp. SIO3I6]NET83769.1 hypothetical protein [Moorena sp. SIO1F2]